MLADCRAHAAGRDALLLTASSQLGVEHSAHLLETVLIQVVAALGWRGA